MVARKSTKAVKNANLHINLRRSRIHSSTCVTFSAYAKCNAVAAPQSETLLGNTISHVSARGGRWAAEAQ